MSQDLDMRIAKCKGWTFRPRQFGSPDGWIDKDGQYQAEYLPNWASSLELMWELEGEFNPQELGQYVLELDKIVKPEGVYHEDEEGELWFRFEIIPYFLRATAEQKAKAWLKVRGG